MPDYVWASDVVRAAWKQVHGREPTLAEKQATMAMGNRESSFGKGWHGAGEGSRNWGAITRGKPPCPDGTFEQTDSFPNSDGSSTQFQQCFATYPTDVDGAADVVAHLTTKRPAVWEAIKRGNLWDMGATLYDGHYYGSTGATREQRIANYVNPMVAPIAAMAKANGEPVALTMGGTSSIAATLAGLVGVAVGVAIATWAYPEIADVMEI